MKKIGAWLPVVLWMGVIFMMSAMPGEVSSEQSGMVVEILTTAYEIVTGGEQISARELDTLSVLVRKAAHMSEYALLAVLSVRAFCLSGVKRPFASAFLLSALFAASDEFHQAFVPGRGPSPVDVAIDACGAAIGAAAFWLCLRWARAKRSRTNRPE